MKRYKPYIGLAAALFASFNTIGASWAGDQARNIVNSLDPKSMNELFDALPTQPDVALTSIAPAGPNKFRFLFVWPSTNPSMTYERVGRSFAERFAKFAGQLQPLAAGFCLVSNSMYFGTANYGEEEVNVAYRDIEVHYQFGSQAPCNGRYFTAEEIERLSAPMHPFTRGYGASVPEVPDLPPNLPPVPENEMKPFPPSEPPQKVPLN
jgi:hypothetical protein